MSQTDATVQLTLSAPAPVPPREGLAPVRVASLFLSDESGRLSGTLEFAAAALGFQVGVDPRVDPPLIEDPANALGEWSAWPDLTSVLPATVRSEDQLRYLREVIGAAEQAYESVVGNTLEAASTFLLAHLNGETIPAAPAPQEDEPQGPEREYVYGTCGCGFPVVFTPDGWQHDSAPWFWGEDHAADPGPVTEDEARRMDALVDAYERGDL